MADPQTGPSWAPGLIVGWWLVAAGLLVVVSCQEDPADVEVVVNTGTTLCSSVRCPPRIYCWEIDGDNDWGEPQFGCDDGYRGPR